MSEHTAEIFSQFGNTLLESELERLEERIEELESRRQLILDELFRRGNEGVSR